MLIMLDLLCVYFTAQLAEGCSGPSTRAPAGSARRWTGGLGSCLALILGRDALRRWTEVVLSAVSGCKHFTSWWKPHRPPCWRCLVGHRGLITVISRSSARTALRPHLPNHHSFPRRYCVMLSIVCCRLVLRGTEGSICPKDSATLPPCWSCVLQCLERHSTLCAQHRAVSARLERVSHVSLSLDRKRFDTLMMLSEAVGSMGHWRHQMACISFHQSHFIILMLQYLLQPCP